MAERASLVTFASDFGTRDGYVAAVKGVMLGVAPGLTIVDVSHEIAPQQIEQAVFVTGQAWPFFPPGCVHLVVVDPGVGTDRAAIALRGPHGYAVGPDNGCLSAFVPEEARTVMDALRDRSFEPLGFRLPAGYEARIIENPAVVRAERSATFHGRDVFGPAAAHLAGGFPFDAIGPSLERVWLLPPFAGHRAGDGVRGRVVHIDRFGNLITSIRGSQLPEGAAELEIAGHRARFVRTYGEGRGLVALIGSSGYVEMAMVNGSAAARTGAGLGAPAIVRQQ